MEPENIILLCIGLILYFTPSAIGSQKRNIGAIFTLNLLLGWTVLGWIVCLVWAMCKDRD